MAPPCGMSWSLALDVSLQPETPGPRAAGSPRAHTRGDTITLSLKLTINFII